MSVESVVFAVAVEDLLDTMTDMPRKARKETAPPALDLDLLEDDVALLEELLNEDLVSGAPDDWEAPTVPGTLPLIPIRDSVYFPGMIFPLILGRERSVRSVESAMESQPRMIALVAQRDLLVEDPEPDDLYEMGIVAEVMQMSRMPDNMLRVLLEAGPRIRVKRFIQTDPYLLIEAESLPLPPEPATPAIEALTRIVTRQFERLVTDAKGIPPEALVNVLSVDEPGRLADTIIPYLSLRVEHKQALLETLAVPERLEKLAASLHEESAILEIQKDIRSRVEKEMGDHQREFFLREQLKAIQVELGEADERVNELAEYREKINAVGMPAEILVRALKELDRFEKTPAVSPEAGVLRNYLDMLVSMPWNIVTEDRLDILEAERILEEDHYGLPKVKERILEFLAVRKLAGEKLKAPILCFVGPPGVGKTSLGRSVALALGRKFARLSLGGVRDEAEIRGHRRTYVGAMPGRILQAIRQSGSRNPVIVLDEIDKLGNDFRGDPSSALLEALDPEQNREFSDHYLEVPFDLSQALFIATANLLDTVPPALRDRLEVISFSGYIEAEKKAIAQNHLLPRQRESHGLTETQFQLQEEALLRLIREYTREAGVRNLHREIGSLCRKAARKIAGDASITVDVNTNTLETLLGKPRFDWGRMEEVDEVGSATGLVYTEAGGDTVTIEVLPTRGEGRLTLTGQLGEVMRESAQTAWTFVRSRLATLGIPEDADAGKDIHIHVPAGAVPKDGPSAGVTIAVALASAIGGQPVRRDVAMTGEITLRGRVLPVGGIKEKVLAAHRAGIRTVLLPAENEKDLDDLPDDVRAELAFVFLRHADDALKAALVAH